MLGSVNVYNSHGSLIGNYSTIQDAVNFAGTVAGANKTIVVDGQSYNGTPSSQPFTEQVTVDAAANGVVSGSLTGLTIKGINGAILQAPTTPLVSTATDPAGGRDIDGVLTLLNTSGVTVEGLTVDGATEGANLASGQNSATEVGIAAVNATGTTIGQTGTANAVTVENVRESDAGFGIQRGLGIYVTNTAAATETNTVTIQNATVENFQKNGITVKNAIATVQNNNVIGTVNNIIAQNGIEIAGTSPTFGGAVGYVSGTVSGNTVNNIGLMNGSSGDLGAGILELNAKNLSIDSNSVTLANYATASTSPASPTVTVQGQSVSAGLFADGIDAINYGEAQSNVSVTNNVVNGVGSTGDASNPGHGIDYQDGLGGGSISGNTVNGFDVGIENDPDTTGTNGTAPPSGTNNTFGSNIGKAYFQGDGSFMPAPRTVAAGSTFTSPGPGQIYVTDANGNVVVDSVFSSIQAAVNAASSGDTIDVGAGTYSEQVVVNGASNLTIEGAPGAVLQAPSALVSTVNNPISGAPLAGVLTLENSSDVTVVGLTIDGDTQGNGTENEVGIAAVNSTGTAIGTLNGVGGAANAVTVENVRDPAALFGDQQGYAVFAANAAADAGTFQIENTTITNFQKSGILAEGAGLAATITGNTVTGAGETPLIAQNGIELNYGATGSITYNTVTGVDYMNPPGTTVANATDASGILAFEPGSGVTVSNNTITGPAANFGDDGIFFYNADAATAQGNTISNEGYDSPGSGAAALDEMGTFTTALNQSGNTYTNDALNYQFLPDPTSTTPWTVTGTGGPDDLEGSAGNDTFTVMGGANGNDFVGNGGIDTVKGYTAGNSLEIQNGHWVVTNSRSTDTLTGISKVVINGQTYDLVDQTGAGVGGYQSIQAAVTAASPGDIIEIAGGTYDENVNVDKNLTIENVPGQQVTIDSQGGYAGAITVASGVAANITGDSSSNFVLNAAAGSNTFGLYLVGDNGATTISNVTVNANGENALVTGGGENGLTVEGSTFGGTGSQLVYVNGVDGLGSGSPPGTNQDSNINFTNNAFSGTATGVLLGIEANSGTISGNTFSGTAPVGLGLAEPGMTVTGNTFGSGISSEYFSANSGYPPQSIISNNTFTSSAGEVYVTGTGAPDAVFSTIQAAIDAAQAGDVVYIDNGTYNENVALANGVSLQGQSQAGVIINGTMSTPASFDDTTVSNLTVTNTGGSGMLLDMTGTQEVTDSVFANDTFSLTHDYSGAQAIGNGQVSGSIALNGDANNTDGIGGSNGLTFNNVTANSNDFQAGSTAFAYTLFHSAAGAQLVLNGVNLEGTSSDLTTGLGAQWNLSPNTGETSAVTIENSNTSGGGNFYASGMASAKITGNVFNGQGLALNGVSNGTVTNNTFENIDGSITSNGTQHRGLVIENAFGTTADNNISVTGNRFNNITTTDGAIALQRFTNGPAANPNLATVSQLSDVTIEGNTFTALGQGVNPIYLNPTYFGTGAVIPSMFSGSQIVTGTSGNDSFTDTAPGNVGIFGGEGTDTATFGAGYTLGVSNGQWTVTNGAKTDTLDGIEKVVIGNKTYDLVDHFGTNAGGFQTIQAAVNAASSGDTILVAGNTTYNEQVVVDGNASNAPNNLTIQGMAGAVLQAPTTPLVSTATDIATSARNIDGVLTLKNTSGVTVEGLTVDGATEGANFVSGQNNPTEVGIAAINTTGTVIGGTGAANAVTVENVREGNDGFGDQRGLGVYVENSVAQEANTVTVQNTTVQNFQKNGITVKNAAATVINNTVVGTVNDVQAQNGIEVGGTSAIFGGTANGAVSGTVSGNTITNIGLTYDYGDEGDTAAGILALNGNNLTITNNSVSLSSATTLAVSGRTPTANAFADGIDAINYGEAQNNVSVTNNTITGAGPTGDPSVPGRGIDYQAGTGGAVTSNSVGGFDVGIEIDPDNSGANGTALPGTAPPSVSGDTFGAIGTDYFVADAPGGSETFTNPTGSAGFVIGSSALTLNITQASTYAGVIEDGSSGNTGGSVFVTGTAPLTLTGVSTYTGKTSVSGTLALAGSGSIQSSSKVSLTTSGATLDISGVTTGATINKLGGIVGTIADLGSKNLKIKVQGGTVDTFSGLIQDGGIAAGAGGSLTLGGLGELVLTGANTYTGATTIAAGTLALTGTGSIAASNALALQASGATFDISGASSPVAVQTISGAAGSFIDLGAGTLTDTQTAAGTFAGVIQDAGSAAGAGGNLVVAGAAALTLTGINTYTGKTSVSGTLDLAGSGSIQSSTKVSLTTAGATLDISGASTGEVVNKLGGIAGTVADLGSHNLKIKVQGGTVDTFAGTINDGGSAGGVGGSLTLGGTGVLSLTHANNTYTGGTTIAAGTLDIAALGAAGSGTITFANPANNGVATLAIDAAALSGGNGFYDFVNTIAGAASPSQVIDLTSLSYAANSTTARLAGNTLLVGNGSTLVALHLAGTNAKSSFTTASDGHGGTLVYDPPVTSPAPATAKIDTGWIEMAMADFGGVPGNAHAHATPHDPYGTGALAPSAHHHAHLGTPTA